MSMTKDQYFDEINAIHTDYNHAAAEYYAELERHKANAYARGYEQAMNDAKAKRTEEAEQIFRNCTRAGNSQPIRRAA